MGRESRPLGKQTFEAVKASGECRRNKSQFDWYSHKLDAKLATCLLNQGLADEKQRRPSEGAQQQRLGTCCQFSSSLERQSEAFHYQPSSQVKNR